MEKGPEIDMKSKVWERRDCNVESWKVKMMAFEPVPWRQRNAGSVIWKCLIGFVAGVEVLVVTGDFGGCGKENAALRLKCMSGCFRVVCSFPIRPSLP